MSRTFGSEAVARFTVHLASGGSYPVAVGRGASLEAPDHAVSLKISRCVVVTDSNVETLHAEAVRDRIAERGLETHIIAFPAGETNKTRAVKEAVEDRMVALGCGRDTAVVALGGGVTGDLAGFVAATYMRGIPCIQMPTSLLAMADASIGGKVGVDHPSGKNLIGAFHPPAAVLTDPSFLHTLPLPEFRIGLAEIVKSAVVGDAGLFEELEARAAALAEGDVAAVEAPLSRAIAVKVVVVSEDEKESDLRKVLNFGHTVGHALERISGYAISHGAAVSIGMVAEAAMSADLGILDEPSVRRLATLLSALGLPVALPRDADPVRVLAGAATDKKARGGRLEFALPRSIGEMARTDRGFGVPVPDDVAISCLDRMREAP